MLKLSLAELEQFIQLVKLRSQDLHVGIHVQHESVRLTFADVDGALVTAELWSEQTRNFAKVSRTERLTESIHAAKANK